MKNLIILIILAVCSINTQGFAQTKTEEVIITEPFQPSVFKHPIYTDPVYQQVDKYPIYTGGFTALEEFLKKNLNTRGETGRVIASFVVEKDGSISNINVVRSFSDQAEIEAIRVIKLMPKWKPGIKNGRIVRTQFTIPISFQKR